MFFFFAEKHAATYPCGKRESYRTFGGHVLVREIARRLNYTLRIVTRLAERFRHTDSTADRPRPARPKSHNPATVCLDTLHRGIFTFACQYIKYLPLPMIDRSDTIDSFGFLSQKLRQQPQRGKIQQWAVRWRRPSERRLLEKSMQCSERRVRGQRSALPSLSFLRHPRRCQVGKVSLPCEYFVTGKHPYLVSTFGRRYQSLLSSIHRFSLEKKKKGMYEARSGLSGRPKCV